MDNSNYQAYATLPQIQAQLTENTCWPSDLQPTSLSTERLMHSILVLGSTHLTDKESRKPGLSVAQGHGWPKRKALKFPKLPWETTVSHPGHLLKNTDLWNLQLGSPWREFGFEVFSISSSEEE